MGLDKNWERTVKLDGHMLSARISPCSWMYPTYGLQVGISLDGDTSNGGTLFRNLNKYFEHCSEADAERLLFGLHFQKCSKKECDGVRLVASQEETEKQVFQENSYMGKSPYRRYGPQGLCEKCFLQELNEEWQKEKAKEEAEDRLHEAREIYPKGYRWAVDAWIHPERGSDELVAFYFVEKPSDVEIKQVLQRNKSRVLDDFSPPRAIQPVAKM